MNVYTWMIAIIVGLSFLLKGDKKDSKFFVILAIIIMFAVMGFREATLIGNDSSTSYLNTYKQIESMDWNTFRNKFVGFNVGFYYLMKIVCNITKGNYQIFIILISAFIMLSFGHFINRYSVSPIQSICYYWGLLLYTFMFSAEKQAIAMSILLFAFDAIIDKRPVKFIILVLISVQFHFPALVLLPAYLISKAKIDRYYILLLGTILVITLIFRDEFLNLMLRAYGNEDIYVSMSGQALLRTKSIIMIGIVVVAIVLRTPNEEDRIYSILLKFMGMAIVFQTFCGYNNVFERLADYYFQFAIVFIPLVFERNDKIICSLDVSFADPAKKIASIIFSMYGVFRFINTVQDSPMLFPYVFFFNK